MFTEWTCQKASCSGNPGVTHLILALLRILCRSWSNTAGWWLRSFSRALDGTACWNFILVVIVLIIQTIFIIVLVKFF